MGSLPNVKVILSGMSTMEQVEDNLRTFAEFRPLSDVSYDPDHVRRNGLEDALDQVRYIADETLAYTKQMAILIPWGFDPG